MSFGSFHLFGGKPRSSAGLPPKGDVRGGACPGRRPGVDSHRTHPASSKRARAIARACWPGYTPASLRKPGVREHAGPGYPESHRSQRGSGCVMANALSTFYFAKRWSQKAITAKSQPVSHGPAARAPRAGRARAGRGRLPHPACREQTCSSKRARASRRWVPCTAFRLRHQRHPRTAFLHGICVICAICGLHSCMASAPSADCIRCIHWIKATT